MRTAEEKTVGLKNVDNEIELLQLVKDGDPCAMKMIYSRYIRVLTALCGRYIINDEDVKDVLQDSFVKIFRTLDSFRYTGQGSLRAWLSRIVVNKSIDFLKERGRIIFTPVGDFPDRPDDPDADTTDLPASVIYGFIRELPDGYRTIFNLYVIEEKSHREIAGMLNIKESTSASQLHRAKQLLAKRIKEYLNNTNI